MVEGKLAALAAGERPDWIGRKIDEIAAENNIDLPPDVRLERREGIVESLLNDFEEEDDPLLRFVKAPLVEKAGEIQDIHKHRNSVPADLLRIADDGGHEVKHSPVGSWLTWGTNSSLKSVGDSSVLSALFPDPEIMKYSDGSGFYFTPSPTPSYVVSFEPADFESEQNEVWTFYQQADHAFVDEDSGTVELGKQHGLITVNNRLKEQLRITGRLLKEGPLAAIRGILKVWFVETAHRLGERIKAQSVNRVDAEREIEQLWDDAEFLWSDFKKGRCGDELNERINDTLLRQDTPDVLARHARDGFSYLLFWRDRLLAYAYPLYRKHMICESMLLSADQGEEVLGWEEMKRQQGPPKRHSRTNKNTWKRRTRAVATILLVQDEETGKLVKRPGWEDAYARDLFKKVAHGESHLSGDDPANSIEDYFRRNLGKDFPTGGDMGGWFELALKWAEDVPKNLFGTK